MTSVVQNVDASRISFSFQHLTECLESSSVWYKSKAEVNGRVPFTCGYNQELTENAARRYAELTRGATTNIVLKRVLITLAITLAFVAVSLIPGGLAAYGLTALATNLTAALTFVGTVATIGFGLAAPVLVYEHTRALKQCTNKECRINEGFNIAETLLDVIDFASLAVLPSQSLDAGVRLNNPHLKM